MRKYSKREYSKGPEYDKIEQRKTLEIITYKFLKLLYLEKFRWLQEQKENKQ